MRKKQIIILGVVMGVALVGLIFTQARYFQTAFKLKKAQFDYLVNKSIDQVISYIEEKDKLRSATEKSEGNEHRWDGNGMVHEIPLGLNINPGMHLKNDMNIIIDYSVCPMEYGTKSRVAGMLLGQKGNRSLQSSIEKSRQELKSSLGKEYDLVVVTNSPSEPERTLEERLQGVDLKQVIGERLKNNGITARFEYAVKENGQFILMSQNFFNRHSDYTYSRKMFLGGSQSQASLFLIFPDQTHDLLSSVFLLLPSLIITVLLVLCFGFCIMIIIKQKKL